MLKRKKAAASSLVVTQSNKLITARYALPLGEQRLVLTMISRIQPDDEDFKPYKIAIGELADFLGIARGSAYRECKKITKSLLTRVLEIQEPGRLLQVGWVSSADYVDGSGTVTMSFDPLLKPYLLQLKGNFTSFRLEMILGFKSQYTMRMYAILKQYENLKEREFELIELQQILGILKDQYKDYKHFKSRILLSTQKELAEKSDLSFEFDEIKYGRKVGAIRFRIFPRKYLKSNNDEVLEKADIIISTNVISEKDDLSVFESLLSLVPEQQRIKKTVQSSIESFERKYDFEYVKRNILYSNAKALKSYAGFLNNALKGDWGHDWELEQIEMTKKKNCIEVWERNGFSSEKEYNDYMFKTQMRKYAKIKQV